ncbi:hypothetical protein DTO013E5_3153 [Penicillium roqueforti]|uniref:uncharacterized protein n=1 Tax=Penicillium roqueforti TaxID=5082 RepID=UPI00190C8944|nr:uncharacterized protein LCP9604111_6080 [Penicillium roqueforti]XP_057038966.1 uncharacterized protein N7518_006336 [Penicillium psychrosexuale]KAF9247890.1 hypothetical protein LCP9604111_6080 [Penicillium roqueforti]KAI2677974.1 hypothetical protein CBS147355_4975 [Penicillium roqueforti]KAI2686675.1 hypothetical protein LCP963914a_4275 [Penicillium roqueforti]KAI2704338.1 hypothetical protein CBS147372_2807 [Penicillium roqueforti]KAI2715970.1 hypothetical protein CBS147318_5821 [Penici
MSGADSDFDLSKALAELAKGEMTASALENHLSAIESQVDELLASFEKQAAAAVEATSVDETDPSQPETDQDQKVEPSNSPAK